MDARVNAVQRVLCAAVLAAMPLTAAAQSASSAAAAELRVLDKLSGQVTDLAISTGDTQEVGNLRIRLNDCRYPTDNPSGDAYVSMIVSYRDNPEPAFQGWMIASAPALNAMDHPRYDVWVLRCITS